MTSNGKYTSLLLGIALVSFGFYAATNQIVPWKASLAIVLIGSYMMLPRRMRTLGDWLVDLLERAVSAWKSRNGRG